MTIRAGIAGAVCLAGVLGGCSASHLVYVHNATLGVELTPPGGEGTARFVFGYDRDTFALVPRVTPKTGDGDPEAMSLAAASRVHVEGLGKVHFGHLIATGDAAASVMSADPNTFARAVRDIFDGPDTTGKADEGGDE